MADDKELSCDKSARRKSSRILSKGKRLDFEEEDIDRTDNKRKRNSEGEEMASKQRKGEDGQPEPTNAEIMRAVNGIAGKLDELASKKDLDRVEKELHNKIHEKARETNQQIRTNARMIAEARNEMAEHKAAICKLQERVDKQEGRTVMAQAGAAKRIEAQQGAFMRCRRSFRIWPVERTPGQAVEDSIRQFFKIKMRVPETFADEVNIDTIRQAVEQPARSKIRQEFIVTFADRESRDTVKSYARELAHFKGAAGLRLDIPDHLKGFHKVLEEHAYAMINLYGKDVKRNIKFDDRSENLMMDIRLPNSARWHNITVKQALEARKIKEEKDLQAIRSVGNERTVDKERTKALCLAPSPSAISRSSKGEATATPIHGFSRGLSMFSDGQ